MAYRPPDKLNAAVYHQTAHGESQLHSITLKHNHALGYREAPSNKKHNNDNGEHKKGREYKYRTGLVR
jgi:hypothetical protein